MMKPKTFQACNLMHSIKKGMFSVLSKLNLFKSGRGSRPPLPPQPTPASPPPGCEPGFYEGLLVNLFSVFPPHAVL